MRKSQRLIVLFGVFLLTITTLILGAQWGTNQYIERNRRLVTQMNHARQQAVFTEQLIRQPIQPSGTHTSWQQWDAQHFVLSDTAPLAQANAKVDDLLDSLANYHRSILQAQLQASESGITPENWEPLLENYSRLAVTLANRLELNVQNRASTLKRIKSYIFFIIMGVLLLEATLMVYPAYMRERKASKELARVNVELQHHNDELQTREEELSQNLEEITALQDQLAASENRYRSLVESSEDIIYELSDTGAFSYINPTFTRLLGYDKPEVIGLGYWEFIREDYREMAVNFYLDQIKNTQPNSYLEIPIQTKDGETIWVGQNIRIEYNGDWVTRVFAIARDITQLKEIQDQLEESERLYRLLSENARDLVALHDADGKVRFLSPSFEDLLGYNPQDFVGHKFQELFHPDDLEALRREYRAKPNQGRQNHNTTYRIRHADGHYIWFESITRPILNKEGKIDYLQTASRDVTARVEAEIELRRKKEILSEAQRVAKMASWEYDRKSRVFHISEEIQEVIPYFDYRNELTVDEYKNIIHPDDLDNLNHLFQKALRNRVPYTAEVRHLLPKGDTITLALRGKPQINIYGEVEKVVGSMQDITEAKRQRDLLQRKQEELAIFINAAPAAMAMFDNNMRYITANQRWVSDLGLGVDDPTGKNHYEILPKWNPVWRNYIIGGMEEPQKRPFKTLIKGQEEWVKWECKPWYNLDGVIGGAVFFAELITERMREEQEQQVQQLRMQTIYRVVSRVGGILSEQINDVIRLATEELGMQIGILSKIRPDDDNYEIVDVYAPGYDFKPGERFTFHETYCQITYDLDSIVTIDHVRNSPYHNHPCYTNTNLEAYIGVTIWVQGKRFGTLNFSSPHPLSKPFKQIDKDYMQLVGQWVSAALERTKYEEALIQAKDTAEAATEAKAQFLSMMSHEIRTPLNAVIGMTHLLLQENPRKDQLENLKTLRFSGENLLVLINDILDFSKIEAGKITLERVPFNLREITNGIHNSLGYKAREKGIGFYLHWPEEAPEYMVGDPVRISQVLTNLCSNAVKFTEEGHVNLYLKIQERVDDQVRIQFRVEDSGIGIPEEKKDSIFESFTQARSDTTRRYGGTGLGLAITKRLLELMDSEIVLESKEGKGSIFSFSLTLPVASPAQTPTFDTEIQPDVSEEELLKKVKILLVEDNPVNQLVATKFLRRWKISSEIAQNGVEAVAMIQSKSYHLVLMDLQMPEMDGYEASRTIRSLEGAYFKEVPIIALTASAMQDVRNKVLASGMTDFVTKPFNPVELHRKIVQYAQENTVTP